MTDHMTVDPSRIVTSSPGRLKDNMTRFGASG